MVGFKAALLLVVIFLATSISAQNPAVETDVFPIVYVTEQVEFERFPNFDLYVMNPLSGELIFQSTTSARECPLGISPDGKQLVYVADTIAGSEISYRYYLVDLQTAEQTEINLTDNDKLVSGLTWNAEGKEFVFVVNQGERKIYRYYTDTHTLTADIDVPSYVYLFRWANEPAYWFFNENSSHITVNDFSGRTVQFSSSSRFTFDGFSPDGRLATFAVREDNEGESKMNFYLRRTDGTRDISISDVARGGEVNWISQHLAWRMDSMVVFYLDLDGNFVLYDLELGTKTLIRAPYESTIMDRMRAAWSPDGRYIAYQVYHGSVSHMDLNELRVIDTFTRQIITISAYDDFYVRAGFVQWINEHEFVYIDADYTVYRLAEGDQPGDLMRYDLATNTRTQLTDTPELIERLDCWRG